MQLLVDRIPCGPPTFRIARCGEPRGSPPSAALTPALQGVRSGAGRPHTVSSSSSSTGSSSTSSTTIRRAAPAPRPWVCAALAGRARCSKALPPPHAQCLAQRLAQPTNHVAQVADSLQHRRSTGGERQYSGGGWGPEGERQYSGGGWGPEGERQYSGGGWGPEEQPGWAAGLEGGRAGGRAGGRGFHPRRLENIQRLQAGAAVPPPWPWPSTRLSDVHRGRGHASLDALQQVDQGVGAAGACGAAFVCRRRRAAAGGAAATSEREAWLAHAAVAAARCPA